MGIVFDKAVTRDGREILLPLGIEVPPSVLAGCVVCALTGSPGLLRQESTGLVSTAFTDDPLARFALVSSACAAPAALCARTGAICPRGPLAGRLGSRSRLALGTRNRQTESSRKVSHQHSHDLLRGRHREAASPARFSPAGDSQS
jgi:hypothetical protein